MSERITWKGFWDEIGRLRKLKANEKRKATIEAKRKAANGCVRIVEVKE